ncbi:MAG: ABC transporter substrate-binding protein [Alphaproteobacteria bacterium]|nr:ABC transporter substrate-binding protein [Alphaproteobacteria bacterium]
MLRILRPVSCVGFLALLLASTSLGFPATASAETASATPAVEAAAATPQGKFIQGLGDKAIAILANKSLSPDERSGQFRNMLRDTFDLITIGRFALGRVWNAATPDQQKEYMRLFEELVVKTYSDRFALYTGEGFRVRAVHPEGEKDFIVNSDITHPDGSPPTTVDWRVRQKGDKLGIIDVVVEGVSMSVTQRQEYAAVIQRNGGNIDGLLDVMRQRIQEKMPVTASKG